MGQVEYQNVDPQCTNSVIELIDEQISCTSSDFHYTHAHSPGDAAHRPALTWSCKTVLQLKLQYV
jgi:hypothetical protein